MEDRKDITVPMPGEMVDAVEAQLMYGDSRAGWIRDAVQQRLEREGAEIASESDTDSEDVEGNGTREAAGVS